MMYTSTGSTCQSVIVPHHGSGSCWVAGEVIRSTLEDYRERRWQATGLGNYLFRLDRDRVVDATRRVRLPGPCRLAAHFPLPSASAAGLSISTCPAAKPARSHRRSWTLS